MAEQIKQVTVPDIGGAEQVDVIEIFVKPGDEVNIDDSLITLEGDKATMEVPSPLKGIVDQVNLKTGDKVSAGSLILTLKTTETEVAQSDEQILAPKSAETDKSTKTESPAQATAQPESQATAQSKNQSEIQPATSGILAGPAARRLAREVGIQLTQLSGTGSKGRITKEDVQTYIKRQLSGTGLALNVSEAPTIDFSKFGPVEEQTLSKIKKISGATLHRNWVTIPHVTQFGEADVTEMEAFRQQQKSLADKNGYKLTPLVFIMKAVVAALKQFPSFNASLDASLEKIILKKYFHLGVAVDTPNGLVVPVIRNVDQKGMIELAKELVFVSKKVRETGLSLSDMQGGCFTISSLGGIGGTAFTPIINAPEVAILGVSKSEKKLVYQVDRDEFVPRLMLPLSLSYDHRVIDGAEGARFLVYLSELLTDIRHLLL